MIFGSTDNMIGHIEEAELLLLNHICRSCHYFSKRAVGWCQFYRIDTAQNSMCREWKQH
jgi:hypothetical protein